MMIRILAALSAIVWAIATVRVWQDANNPYSTMVCIILTIASIATTIHPEIFTFEDEDSEVAR
ncbi:hypothetical protein INS90_10230 [Trueperella pecoris]|uniref:Uncharacterized protein n=1 Tax=Trueperella pecoris TaxID=2733571 RepID=A0A7M1R0D1_9ACTO|nr:hypothetical protein [Trueperella pecoris]QOR47606.1 hypothetical protein INS90_10230 [Trueperella pecoris]